MAFIEIINAILTLDIGYLIAIVLGNPFWFFAFFAAGFFFSGGKRPIVQGLVFYLLVVTAADVFTLLTYVPIYTGVGLFFLYTFRVPLLLYMEKSGLDKYYPLAWVLSFYFIVAVVSLLGL